MNINAFCPSMIHSMIFQMNRILEIIIYLHTFLGKSYLPNHIFQLYGLFYFSKDNVLYLSFRSLSTCYLFVSELILVPNNVNTKSDNDFLMSTLLAIHLTYMILLMDRHIKVRLYAHLSSKQKYFLYK